MNVQLTSTVRFADHRVAGAALVGIESFVALGAIFGGVGLIADNAIGMLPEWLEGTPFTSWFWPGVFLLLVVAAPMVVAAYAEMTSRRWAYAASLVAGAAQVGWIIVQWLIFQRFFILQPIMLLAGIVVIGLAWWVRRGEPVWPRGR